jgi:hypothetical protein
MTVVWRPWNLGDDLWPLVAPVIQAKCSPRLAALGLAASSVWFCFSMGLGFSLSPVIVCEPAFLSIDYFVPWATSSFFVAPGNEDGPNFVSNIAVLGPRRDSLAVFLGNGDLCPLKTMVSLLAFCSARWATVHCIACFFKYRVNHVECQFDFLLLMTDEGPVFIAHSQSYLFAPLRRSPPMGIFVMVCRRRVCSSGW